MLGGQRETVTRDDDDDLLQFAIQQSLLEAGSEYDQVRARWAQQATWPRCRHSQQAPALSLQVTIWEALTNSKPGTHPMSYEGCRQDRSVSSRVWRCLRTPSTECPSTLSQRVRTLPTAQPLVAQRNHGTITRDPAGIKMVSAIHFPDSGRVSSTPKVPPFWGPGLMAFRPSLGRMSGLGF